MPGGLSGAIGYRRELAGQRRRVLRLGLGSLLGGAVGAGLLLVLPAGAFSAIVPVLVVLGCVLVVLQPTISAWVARRHDGSAPADGAWWVWPAVLLTGVYGGYFGAAQGVLLMAVMGIGIDETLQRLNGVKNVLASIANAIAGLVFIVVADVDWAVVALIAVGSVVGGQLGASYGRRLPATALRALIVVVGLTAVTALLLG
ncbi:Putative permease (fragment) [metagenome]|uniref:Permease n=1 Tax=metagenome TaxID=256318 RepID=A0A2P2C6R6_9ZZZZ